MNRHAATAALAGLLCLNLNLFAHHYELLKRLRRDEPEAWGEVSELMEND